MRMYIKMDCFGQETISFQITLALLCAVVHIPPVHTHDCIMSIGLGWHFVTVVCE